MQREKIQWLWTKKKNWLIDIQFLALLAGFITFFVYVPALENGFVTWDDNDYVYENDHIRHINGEFFNWAITGFYAGNWHPLTWFSHALDYALWGLNPKGHHLTSILLHSVNTMLVVFLAKQLLRRVLGSGQTLISNHKALSIIALLTGLFFGLQPLHVESVAWVSERKDLFCAFFYLSSLLFYSRTWQSSPIGTKLGEMFRNSDYLLCLMLFVFALMSKPMAVSLPVVLLLLDWLHDDKLNRRAWWDNLLAKIPFLLLALASALVTIAAQKSGDSITSLAEVPIFDRLWVASFALVAYLQKLVWPLDLLPYYRYPKSVDWMSAKYLGSALLIVAITMTTLLNIRRHRSWAIAWGCYVVMLVPVLGIVKVGGQAMADRYMYLPSIAPLVLLSVILVWGLLRWSGLGKWTGTRVIALLAITLPLLGAMSFLTQKQIGIWKSGETLWSYVIRYDDQIPLAYEQLGISLFNQARFPEAADVLNKALSLNPFDAGLLSNLAICYLELGKTDEAMRVVQNALIIEGKNLSALNTLGEVHMARNEYSEANKVFHRAMQLQPENPLRIFNLAVSFDKLGVVPQACIYWRRFMRVDVTQEHDTEIIKHLSELNCPVNDS